MESPDLRPVPASSKSPRLSEKARRSLAKTISWRCIGSLDTMLISFLVFYFLRPTDPMHVAKAASLVGLLEVPNKLLLYYFHERAWARIKWGRVPPPEYQI